MKKILINFAHPAKSRSSINIALRKAVESLEGVTVNDLYAQYPDFLIDVKREQTLCEEHDIIVFQHPFYWYSTPSILKEWQDLVLEHGWAYGSDGNALSGKMTFQAISAGGDASTYSSEGFNKFSFIELTSPYQATANLCKMRWYPPFTIAGVHRGLPKEQVEAHAEDYRRTLIALRDERFDLDAASLFGSLNENLNQVIGAA